MVERYPIKLVDLRSGQHTSLTISRKCGMNTLDNYIRYKFGYEPNSVEIDYYCGKYQLIDTNEWYNSVILKSEYANEVIIKINLI